MCINRSLSLFLSLSLSLYLSLSHLLNLCLLLSLSLSLFLFVSLLLPLFLFHSLSLSLSLWTQQHAYYSHTHYLHAVHTFTSSGKYFWHNADRWTPWSKLVQFFIQLSNPIELQQLYSNIDTIISFNFISFLLDILEWSKVKWTSYLELSLIATSIFLLFCKNYFIKFLCLSSSVKAKYRTLFSTLRSMRLLYV